MWQGRTLLLDFGPNNSMEEEMDGRKKEREEEGRERSSTISLDFQAIRSSIRAGARGKVLPRGKIFK